MDQISELRELEQQYAQLRLEEALTRATGVRVAERLANRTLVMHPADADELLAAIDRAAADAADQKQATLQRLIAARAAARRAA